MRTYTEVAEEHMVITVGFHPSRIPFFNKNTLITKAKKNKESVLLSWYYRSVKTLLSLYDSNVHKDHAKQGEKEQTNEQFANLPIKIIFAETNTNACVEKYFKIHKHSLRLNEIMNIVEFFIIKIFWQFWGVFVHLLRHLFANLYP